MSAKLPDDGVTEAEMKLAWRRAVTETRAVLRQASAAWSKHSCPGTSECCQLAVTKRPPWLWPSEWLVLEERLRRDKRSLPPERSDGGCPLLDPAGKRCTVYEDRPLGCGWFDSSHELERGLQVQEADATALSALPLGDWLALELRTWCGQAQTG